MCDTTLLHLFSMLHGTCVFVVSSTIISSPEKCASILKILPPELYQYCQEDGDVIRQCNMVKFASQLTTHNILVQVRFMRSPKSVPSWAVVNYWGIGIRGGLQRLEATKRFFRVFLFISSCVTINRWHLFEGCNYPETFRE